MWTCSCLRCRRPWVRSRQAKLRPLAVTSAKRSSSLPDVPTVAESGFKDFDVSTWYGVFAPAGTPAAVVTTVNAEINKLLATADMKAAIQAQGAEPEAMSPAQLGTLLRRNTRSGRASSRPLARRLSNPWALLRLPLKGTRPVAWQSQFHGCIG